MADANMMKDFLDRVQKAVVDVRFEKADGTQTNRKVTLDPNYIPEERSVDDLMESLEVIMEKDYIRVYSVTDQGWRTIKPTKLISWIGA